MEQILLTVRELKRYEIVQARLKSGCKIEKILSDYDNGSEGKCKIVKAFCDALGIKLIHSKS